jgi:hypothetical protein
MSQRETKTHETETYETEHVHLRDVRRCRICRRKRCIECTEWVTLAGCARCREFVVCTTANELSCLEKALQAVPMQEEKQDRVEHKETNPKLCSLCADKRLDCGHFSSSEHYTCENCSAVTCYRCGWKRCAGNRCQSSLYVCTKCQPLCRECAVLADCPRCKRRVCTGTQTRVACVGQNCRAAALLCSECISKPRWRCGFCNTVTVCGACAHPCAQGTLLTCSSCLVNMSRDHAACFVAVGDRSEHKYKCRKCALATHAELVPGSGRWIERKVPEKKMERTCAVGWCRREATDDSIYKCSHANCATGYHFHRRVCAVHTRARIPRLRDCTACKKWYCYPEHFLLCSSVNCAQRWCGKCAPSNLTVQTGVVEDECIQCGVCQTGARTLLEEHVPARLAALIYQYVPSAFEPGRPH